MNKFTNLRNNFSKASKYIELEKKYSANNYAPLPVVLARGKGIHVWDVDGKEYIDCLAGYSSINQGHCHPKIIGALKDQCDIITMTSRAFYNSKLGEVSKYISEYFGYDKVLYSSGGCETCEAAIKFSRRWGYLTKGIPENMATVVYPYGNFWGRSITACGSSDEADRNHNFGPYSSGHVLVEYNNAEALEKVFKENPNVCAYFFEPIQGEKGVIIPNQGYLKEVRRLCDKYNVLMIVDEIQTGLGRTGKLMDHYYDDVRPDIVTTAKALTGGVYPCSAFMADSHIMDLVKPGEHGSTYGGNPLALVVAQAALEVIKEENLCENSYNLGNYMLQELQKFSHPSIKEVRGRGLFIAVEMKADYPKSAYDLCLKLKDNGVLAKQTHKTTIRFSPPLVINKQQVDHVLDVISQTFKTF